MPGEIRIHNLSRPDAPNIRAKYCDSFRCRFVGLMFRKSLADNEGLLLIQAKESKVDASIHMLFMRMDIAVVWIDSRFQVVDAIMARRWHLAYFPKHAARYVLEMGANNFTYYQAGDRVAFDYEHQA